MSEIAYPLPEGWEVRRLRFLSKLPIKNGIGEAANQDDPDDPRYIRITDIAGPRALKSDTFRSLPREVAADAPVKNGDILLAAVGATFGKSVLVQGLEQEACFAGYLVKFSAGEKIDVSFAAYWTESQHYWDQVRAEVIQSTIQNFSAAKYRDLVAPLPPLEAQRRIAAFLDEKTAQIDGLIEKKRALLDRLAEKRQALITRAVTKGLNPAAPIRPSGIDWLGDIPAHWEVLPVKRVAKLESGHTPDKKIDAYWDDCEIPWVSLNDTAILRAADYISDTTYKINELGLANSSARLLPARAVVFTRDATIGESAITTRPMAVSQHIIAWLCDEDRVIPEYLLFAIYGMRGELMRLTNGSTIGTIGLGDVKSIRMALPPLAEQNAIVSAIVEAKDRLDEVVRLAHRSSAHLTEYRAALITAAVTGNLELS